MPIVRAINSSCDAALILQIENQLITKAFAQQRPLDHQLPVPPTSVTITTM